MTCMPSQTLVPCPLGDPWCAGGVWTVCPLSFAGEVAYLPHSSPLSVRNPLVPAGTGKAGNEQVSLPSAVGSQEDGALGSSWHFHGSL